MKSVKKEILFTLWYITLDENYSTILKNEFPESLETSILLGKTDLSPLPFWYFSARKEVPLKKDSESKVAKQEKEVEKPKSETTKSEPENLSTKEDKNLSEKQEVFTYQLGFYSSKENAQNLVNRCKEKNISAQIQQVTRPSGNVYFAVIVKSTDSEIGTIIKNSGFECYPIFE